MERLCMAEEMGLLHRKNMVMFSVKDSHIWIDRGRGEARWMAWSKAWKPKGLWHCRRPRGNGLCGEAVSSSETLKPLEMKPLRTFSKIFFLTPSGWQPIFREPYLSVKLGKWHSADILQFALISQGLFFFNVWNQTARRQIRLYATPNMRVNPNIDSA